MHFSNAQSLISADCIIGCVFYSSLAPQGRRADGQCESRPRIGNADSDAFTDAVAHAYAVSHTDTDTYAYADPDADARNGYL